jgi:hypothetical protein
MKHPDPKQANPLPAPEVLVGLAIALLEAAGLAPFHFVTE